MDLILLSSSWAWHGASSSAGELVASCAAYASSSDTRYATRASNAVRVSDVSNASGATRASGSAYAAYASRAARISYASFSSENSWV